jgi:hypothetical protein
MRFDKFVSRILKETNQLPFTVYHGTDLKSAKDIQQNGLSLDKCEKGYFGKGFYVTTDQALAKSNYADFSGEEEETGIVLEFTLNPQGKILDLRESKDWEFYQKNKLENYLGDDKLPQIMQKIGIDALYDRSMDAFVVYNLNILKLKYNNLI